MAIATLIEISNQIKLIVQDSGYDSAITGYINDAILELSEMINFPELQAEDTVTASSAADNVSLPDDFQRSLYHVYNTVTECNVQILRHDDLIQRYYAAPAETGDVVCVAIKSGNLYYRNKPSANQPLLLMYYRLPEALSAGSDVPDLFSSNQASIGKSAIVHSVCRKIYDNIEDAFDGRKNNTLQHERLYNEFFIRLKKSCRPDFFRMPSIPIFV